MARLVKPGLDYFSLDVDFFADDKIQFISALYGMKGECILIRLLCKVYRNGYFLDWNDDAALLLARSIGDGCTQDFVNKIVIELVKRNFFDDSMLKTFSILTSRGVQKRYFEATLRRKKVEYEKRYLLINVADNVDINEVNVDINEVNVDINTSSSALNVDIGTQSKVKESKVNKSKVNESKVNTPITPKGDTSANVNQSESNETSEGESLTVETARGTADNPSVDHSMTLNARFSEFWNQYPKKTGKGAAEKAWKQLHPTKEQHETILQALSKAIVCDQWRCNNGQFIPNPLTWLNQRRWEDEYTPAQPQIKQEIYDNEVRLWK